MGHLLYLIVERNRPVSNLMISTVVIYLNANEPGTGFYVLAHDLDLLQRNAFGGESLDFWPQQVTALHEFYGSPVPATT